MDLRIGPSGQLFVDFKEDEIPFICWLESRDGETVRCEGFSSAAELLNAWPYAERVGAKEYIAWIGGGR